jgi:hypothetical protein
MEKATRLYLYGLTSEVQDTLLDQISGSPFQPVCCEKGGILTEPDPILILGKESWDPEHVEVLRRENPACQVLLTLTEEDLDSFLPAVTTRIDDYLILPLNAKRLLFALEKAVDRKVQVERLLRTTKELDQTTEELSYFINVGKALTSTLDTGSILNIIMEKTSELVKA